MSRTSTKTVAASLDEVSSARPHGFGAALSRPQTPGRSR